MCWQWARSMSTTCSSNTVCARNDCQNSQTLCGLNCVDCTELYHAEAATCEDGNCHVTQCKDGYHMVEVESESGSDDYEIRCEPNTDTVCGKTDEVDTERDCTKIPNANSGTCDHGSCKFTCKSNAHEYGDGCELNDRTHCGKSRTKCQDDTDINKYACTGNGNDAVCEIIGCGDDYYLFNSYCQRNTLENCGHVGNNCKLIIGWSDGECRAGECYATSCTYSSSTRYSYQAFNGRCIRRCTPCNTGSSTYCCTGYSDNCNNCEYLGFNLTSEYNCLFTITDDYNYENIFCEDCRDIMYEYEMDPEEFDIEYYLYSFGCYYLNFNW